MKRKYEKDLYADRVATIKRLMPNACIGVDVIGGFPGETDADFLLKRFGCILFPRIHLFRKKQHQAIKMKMWYR